MTTMESSRVLLTGGNGFLGSFVAEKLRRQAWCTEIIIPRKRDTDLRDEAAVRSLLDREKPDIVIHLAASVGGIGANLRNPASFFRDNALMGLHLVHHAYETGVKKFVGLATVCSYPKYTPVPFREDSLWDGYPEETNAPYGLAKKMLLIQAQAYRMQHGFNAITLLPTNLYGPHDNFHMESSHVIPAIIRKCLDAVKRNESTVILWGDGSVTRDFLYVEDAADAIIRATEVYNEPEPLNIGSGKEISIKELAHLIADITNFRGEFRWDARMPNGQPRRCLDSSRARAAISFQPQCSLVDGLTRTIDWYLHTYSPSLHEAHRTHSITGIDVAAR